MGFIGKEIDRDTAKQLIKQYKLTRPWPSSNNFLESSIIALAYSEEDDAICVPVRSQEGLFVNDHRTSSHAPQINTLVWRGYNIRIDLYETFYGDYFNGKIDRTVLVLKRILAPFTLEGEAKRISRMAAEGSLALYRSLLLPGDNQRKSSFRGVDVTFVEEDEIWKL